MTIDLTQLAANVVVVGGGVGAFGLWYKSYIIEAVRAEFSVGLVTKAEYEHDREVMRQDIDQIKKFDIKLGVVEERVAGVQKTTDKIMDKMDNLSKEITGAVERVARTEGKLSK